jgi:manganese efflux pump family protein
MSVICLILWILTAGFGLYLLSIWLIEYDRDFQSVAATRLPPPVLTGHVLVAGGGLLLWIAYLIWDNDNLAWYSVIALVLAASLGLTMAVRWISVYRAKRASDRVAVIGLTAPAAAHGYRSRLAAEGPPERNFPLPVVIIHGVFAVTTLTLVLLTALAASS